MRNKEDKTLFECLVEKNRECEKLKDALKAILLNTLNRNFDGDIMYKKGVLSNVEIGLGKQEFDDAIELYS